MEEHAGEADRRASWVLPLILAGQMAGILLGRNAASPVYGWLAMACAMAAVGLSRGCGRLACLTLLACAVGTTGGWYAYHPDRPEPGTYLIRGVVCEEIIEGDRGQVKTRLCAVTLDGEAVRGDAYWSFYPEEIPGELLPGCAVTFTGRVYEPSGVENPGGFDFNTYLLGQGIRFAVYGDGALTAAPAERFTLQGALAAFRGELLTRLTAVMGEEAGDYAAAMLLGVKQRIPTDDRVAFNRLGMAHVLVVSGFHVGVLAAILGRLLRGRGIVLRTAVTGAILLGYALMTGGHAPVMRALMLYLLAQTGRILRRPRPLLWMLCAAAIVTLLLAPAQLTSVSFQLTYAAVLGMAVVSPWLSRLRKAAYTLGAQAGVLLPLLRYFHELPILGIVVNIVLLPAVSVLIMLYWAVLAALPFPPVAEALGAVAGAATHWMIAAVELLNGFPVASLWTQQAGLLTMLAWAAMMLALSPLVRLRRRGAVTAACLCLLVLSLIPLPHHGTTYTLFSEGNAEASLLWDENYTMVIDTGEDGRDLSDFLHQRRQKIDTLVLTHLHSDHTGGLQALLDARIPVGEVCLPWGAAMTEEVAPLLVELELRGAKVRYLARGDVLTLPSGEATVLWPERGRVRAGADANTGCLVLHVRAEGVSLLLTGDLSGAYAHYVTAPADVLKAAHHGAIADTPADFLAAVDPRVILVPCGRDRSLGHLAGEAAVLDTGTHGAITVRMAEGVMSIETMKE